MRSLGSRILSPHSGRGDKCRSAIRRQGRSARVPGWRRTRWRRASCACRAPPCGRRPGARRNWRCARTDHRVASAYAAATPCPNRNRPLPISITLSSGRKPRIRGFRLGGGLGVKALTYAGAVRQSPPLPLVGRGRGWGSMSVAPPCHCLPTPHPNPPHKGGGSRGGAATP